MKQIKHYIAEISETNGDMEYDTKYLFATNKNPDKYTDKVAMEWRGGDKSDWDKDHEAYWSGMSLIHDCGSTEISKEDFEVLKKYLSVL